MKRRKSSCFKSGVEPFKIWRENLFLSESILHKLPSKENFLSQGDQIPRVPSLSSGFDCATSQTSFLLSLLFRRKHWENEPWKPLGSWPSLHTVSAMACFLGPAAGASPEVPCKGWLLGLQPWALREQPFPPEWACQTKSAANSHFRSVSIVSEPPILSPLFGKNAPLCSQTVGVQSFKERNCIYFLCLYKLPVMLCVCRSLMAVKYRETGAHVPYRPQLPQRRSAILWSSRGPLGTTALLFDTETKAKF